VNRLLLWIAQGFGAGRAPFAQGTFGSLVGLLWFALLLLTGSFGGFLAGTAAGLAVSVWLCDVGSRILKQKDPGSVVLDEITAVPLCFVAWMAIAAGETGAMPGPEFFFSAKSWPLTLGVFAAFRFFDVIKPWPVNRSQSLHGGLGITVDDVLAALYVNAVVLAACAARMFLAK
jgi:phosphatidylglycerophosphatase A